MQLQYTFAVRQKEEQTGEEMLVEAARANPAAFEPLYQRYRERIYRYVFLRIGCQEDAADLTQHIFLKAMLALPGYRSRGVPFEAWLFRIAHHAVNDVYRRKKVTFVWDDLAEAEHIVGDEDPELLLLQEERYAHLRQLLSQLDARKRELVALRFSAGLSSHEIALVVGKSPAAVKKQLSRILQSLKEQM